MPPKPAPLIAASALGIATIAIAAKLIAIQNEPLPTGKLINPQGSNVNVASFPGNMALSPNGRFIAVSNFGFRQQLSILDASTGQLVSSIPFNGKDAAGEKMQMYFGLAFAPDGKLYISRGGEDQISVVDLDSTGQAKLEDAFISVPSENKKEPNFIAGLAISPDGKELYAAGNESYFHKTNGNLVGGEGSLSIVDLQTGHVRYKAAAGGFPFDVAAPSKGPAEGQVFVSNERDGAVTEVPIVNGAVLRINTGTNTANLLLNHDQTKLYASNPGSDTVSVISTAGAKVLSTFLVRPPQQRGLPGATPLGMALSPDDSTLYVACADLNAVAILDANKGTVKGYIPVGWYPTSVLVSPDGQRLFVANAKGVTARNPNAKEVAPGQGTYIEDILEGTVSMIDVKTAETQLPSLTAQVLADDRFINRKPDTFTSPPIRHVIYIVKENRTYDQFFGDIETGNGDRNLCMFPREVTPNQHALAERFVLLDNFYVCAEVSADGWNWSTAGMASDYVERNTVVNYADRGRDYDFEGSTNGFPDDLYGVKDVAEPAGGYIWDACAKAGVSFRNYGFFVSSNRGNSEFPRHNEPDRKVLQGKTDIDFRQFDTNYADSDAWVKLGSHPSRQMLKFGSHDAPCRYQEWKREFDECVKTGNLPHLSMLRMMRDHTGGTSAGISSPRAMVADNDYAIGEIVDAVSHSPYWKDTVICVVEDDAQDGQDHVDCHRSPALIISPYVQKGKVDHRFRNTDSMLRTIADLLHFKPMNQYVGFASPIDAFGAAASNSPPYEAVMPNAEILNEVNTKGSYRAADSARLIRRFDEESAPDIELNDILWGDFKAWRRG